MEGDEEKVNGEENKDFGFSSYLLPNPGDSIDLLTCHSCGIRGSDLQTLNSQWRVVLLCHGCLNRIRSAAVCSYCFRRLITSGFDVLICRSCSCRVHLNCVAVQCRYITLSELDPVSFACVDCCAIPKRQFRNPSRVSMILWENLARNVRSAAEKKAALAARARVKALRKADEARVAMEAAFDAILFARDAVVADDKLALQLHYVVNGSQRIMRRGKLGDLDHSATTLKKKCGDGRDNLMRRKLRKRRGRACEKIDSAFFESKNSSLPKRNSFINLGIGKGKEATEFDACASRSRKVNWDEKKACHFDLSVNCNGDANNDRLTLISCYESDDSNSFMEASECGRGTAEDSPKLQEEKRCTVAELRALKYCKRTSRLNRPMSAKEVKLLSRCS